MGSQNATEPARFQNWRDAGSAFSFNLDGFLTELKFD